jgi:polysaccharide biosynthesis transport protein
MADNQELSDSRDILDIEDTIDIQDYIRIIIKHQRMIILVFSFIVAAGLLYCFTATPVYEATTGIIIDKEEADRDSLQEVLFTDTTGAEYYQTMYKILESRSVASNVIQRLGLDKNDAFFPPSDVPTTDNFTRDNALITAFLGDLKIVPVLKSHYVNINYRAKNPALAAAITNAIVEAYREHAFAMKLESVQNSVQWLNENLAQERKKVETAEQALLAFREKNNIVTNFSSDTETITAQKLAQLNSQVVEAEAVRAEAETRYKQADAVAGNQDRLDSLPDVLDNPLIQQIKTQEVGLLQRKSELSKKYGSQHPQMLALQAELRSLQAKKEQEVQRIINGLNNAWQVALAKEKALKEALAVQKTESFSLNKSAIEYTGLYCEAEGAKAMYALLLKRFKETSVTENLKIGNVRVVDKAEPPLKPVKPKKLLYMLITVMIALGTSLGFAFLLEYLDDTIGQPEDIKRNVQVPFLGLVPVHEANTQGEEKQGTASALETFFAPRSQVSESYRRIRANILFSKAESEPKVILVSSAMAREGKTTTAANIAIVMAQLGSKVLLIDCDFHKPQLRRLFGISREEGMTNLLVGNKELREALFETDIPNLSVIPAGPVSPNPAEILGSNKLHALVELLRHDFDKIIIDSAPLIPVTDALVTAKAVDGVVVVVRTGVTSCRIAKTVVDNLRSIGVPVLGAVLNGVDIVRERYFYAHHYYGYAEKAPEKKAQKRNRKLPFFGRHA